MFPAIAHIAVAIELERDPARRAALERLAVSLLQLRCAEWHLARLLALLCRLTLDERRRGGDDDRRDPAAA